MTRLFRRPVARLFRRLDRLDGAGRWPVGLLGMLALVVAAEFAAARLAPENLLAEAWRQTRADAVAIAPRCELLALGDSQIKHGLLARVLQERLGVRAYNLALQGATAPATYVMLRRVLDAGARPSAIVLDSELLHADPFDWTRQYAELLTPWQALELSWTARDGRIAGALAMAWLLPSFRERDGLRREIKGLCTGRRFEPYWFLQVHRRNWRANLGALVLAPPKRLPRFDDAAAVAGIGWDALPVNLTYLERTLALTAERGIPVYWLLYPIHPAVRAAREPAGWGAGQRRLLNDVLARYPHVTVIDGLYGPACPLPMLSDLTHVNRLGAVAYSAAVADVLAQVALHGEPRPDGVSDRWIALPELRARPVEVAVEDVEQSMEAFKQELRAARLRRKALAAGALAPTDAVRR